MSAGAASSGKEIAIQKMPWITEHDVAAFSPYPAQDGTFGALFQLDEHGRVVLDTLSVERRGDLLFVFINGRMITQLQIDKKRGCLRKGGHHCPWAEQDREPEFVRFELSSEQRKGERKQLRGTIVA